jgi:hypothetical protein
MGAQRFLKKLLANDWALGAAGALVSFYVRLLWGARRWETIGRERLSRVIAQNQGAIFAFWHQRMISGAILRRETDRRLFVLGSQHRDAEIIARAVQPLGIEFIRGSAANPKKARKEKGGAGAVAQMIGALKDGSLIGITPDGPVGPARRSQPGVLRLAQLSGAPIVPIAFSASRGVFLNTWDRFFIAMPFSRAAFVVGEALCVRADADATEFDMARKALEFALDAAGAEADSLVGRSPNPVSMS